jgi:putative hemolysin
MKDSNLAAPLESYETTAQIFSSRLREAPPLLRALRLHPLVKRYFRLPLADSPADFANNALASLGINVLLQGEPMESLPASGPLLLVANHPFGGVEGLVLATLSGRVRPDVKILANQVLNRIPELRPLFIPVDVSGKKNAGGNNVGSLRAALRHLESGGALAVFPSGVVSHWHMRQRCVADPEWNALVGRLARVKDASVVPLYFEGRNSLLFQAAGCLHPTLRTALLPREMWRMRGRGVKLHTGKSVDARLLPCLPDDAARTAHIRARCYALGRKQRNAAGRGWAVPVAPRESLQTLLAEIRDLPPQRALVEEGPFRILHLEGDEAPHMLREIGRLREECFRAAGEGSGKAVDCDRFDSHYSHLVLWNTQSREVAGGYRARRILPSEWPLAADTLYTHTLFRFKAEFFKRCGASMELGRAFVSPEHQRDYAPLMMLWKGIGRLAAAAGIRTLFGPTSIGLDYCAESILMLRRHLEERHFAPELAALAQGRRRPSSFAGPNAPDTRGLDYRTVDRAIKDLEGNKGSPVLFRHYLQLGGRIVAFHEDREFGSLDALMVVDLAAAPEKALARYMGEEGLRRLRSAFTG